MNKLIVLLVLTLVGCASNRMDSSPSAADQVAGLQKMCTESTAAMKARQDKKSLYERLGKRKGINNFFTHLLPEHRANKKIAHLFKHSDDKKVIAHSTDFLVAGSGGPNKYKGRNMEKVHAHLKITNADFLAAGEDVQITMKKLGYGENEIQEVVCALVSFIPQVVVGQ